MTFYLELVGGLFVAWFILVVLFAPHIPYHVEQSLDASSDHFVRVLESACLVALEDGNQLEVFTDGPQFYPPMLEAIRSAREAVNMECYIFQSSGVGAQFIDALVERAQAGVQVRLVLDAIGSFGALRAATSRLCEAGCRVEQYQFPFWYRLHRLNNRTHRELLVVDGRVAFVGGAGVANWWNQAEDGEAMWRDMMVRVEGPVVTPLNVWWMQLGIVHQRIRPGRPQANGTHERMHRELKRETVLPAAADGGAQQARFDAFRRRYNEERPHAALHDATPATRWTPSGRPYPATIDRPTYPSHFLVRRVRSCGTLKWQGRPVFVSEVLAHEDVGFEEVADGLWDLVYYRTVLGRFDARTGRVIGG